MEDSEKTLRIRYSWHRDTSMKRERSRESVMRKKFFKKERPVGMINVMEVEHIFAKDKGMQEHNIRMGHLDNCWKKRKQIRSNDGTGSKNYTYEQRKQPYR